MKTITHTPALDLATEQQELTTIARCRLPVKIIHVQ